MAAAGTESAVTVYYDGLPLKTAKPPEGAPCTGCGLCCLLEPCLLSVEIFGKQDACPALLELVDRYSCGLVTAPQDFVPAGEMRQAAEAKEWGWQALAQTFGKLLGAGRGCDASD